MVTLTYTSTRPDRQVTSRSARAAARRLILIVFALTLLAVTACTEAVTVGDTAASATCDPSPVERRGGRAYVRAGDQIEGQLFYYDDTMADVDVAVMPPHGRAGEGRTTKVLWQLSDAVGHAALTVHGTDLTGGGEFEQSFPEAVAPQGDYPSIIELPEPGCWRLSLTVGDAQGVVTVRSDA